MTPKQIWKALDRYTTELDKDVSSLRFPGSETNPSSTESLAHVRWMVDEAKKFATTKPAKAMRWLCFVQGVLWRDGDWSINEFKDDNKGED